MKIFPMHVLIIPKDLFRKLYRKNRKALKTYLALNGFDLRNKTVEIFLSNPAYMHDTQIVCAERTPVLYNDEAPDVIVRRSVRRFIAKK